MIPQSRLRARKHHGRDSVTKLVPCLLTTDIIHFHGDSPRSLAIDFFRPAARIVVTDPYRLIYASGGSGSSDMNRLTTFWIIREQLLSYLLWERLPQNAIELTEKTPPPLGVV